MRSVGLPQITADYTSNNKRRINVIMFSGFVFCKLLGANIFHGLMKNMDVFLNVFLLFSKIHSSLLGNSYGGYGSSSTLVLFVH